MTRLVTVTPNTAIDRVLEVPGFAVGAHLKATQLRRKPAGKGVNVALTVARLGGTCIATGFVGQAESGAFQGLLDQAEPGRALSQLLPVRGPTRENITLLDPRQHVDTHLRTAGYELSPADLQRLRTKVDLLSDANGVVALCGSLPAGMTPGDLRSIAAASIARGTKVAVDVDGPILASLLSTPIVGPDRLWLVKPNHQELAAVTGQDAAGDVPAVVGQARKLLSAAQWVVVTLGAEGAVLVGESGAWRARCDLPPAQVVSTVGCGDSFLAALLLRAAAMANPAEALRQAVAAGAANALCPGISEFSSQQHKQMLDQAEVHQV